MTNKDILILKDNPKWKYISIEDLKAYLWNNLQYARKTFGIGYAEHDFEVANVYPMIRFIFSDEIEKMYTTKELYKYHGVKNLVNSFGIYEDKEPKKYNEYMERYKYQYHPVWGLTSAGHDNLHYESHIASAVLSAPTPNYSVKYFGNLEKSDLQLSRENRIPCMLAVCDNEKITIKHYGSNSCSEKTYEKTSFPLFKKYVEGKIKWSETSEKMEQHRRKSSLEIVAGKRRNK